MVNYGQTNVQNGTRGFLTNRKYPLENRFYHQNTDLEKQFGGKENWCLEKIMTKGKSFLTF